jgi:adenosylcobinamide-phosphate synthase
MVALVLALFAIPVWAVLHYLASASTLAWLVAAGLLLKPAFSLRLLFQQAQRVKMAIVGGRWEEAREGLRGLVSRDTSGLGPPLLVAAAVESVAENTSDSFVAPLFYYLCFGVAGAVAYRVINTFDAMIGYHGRYEYLGKAAARLDDLANLVPARLTALFIVAASYLTGRSVGRACRIMLRYRMATESPNAGWPMSAMAGALNVQLEKVGHYRLGEPGAELAPARIDEAVTVAAVAAGLATLFFVTVGVIVHGVA